MKRLLIFLFILVCGAVSAQKINQAFTRASGERFILNLSDIAFAYATDTGSTLVLGPAVKTLYVTESIDSVSGYSGGALQKFTEIRRGLSGGVTRPVAVSLNHVSEAVRSTTPQGTLIKMKNPVMTVLVSDTITTVIDKLSKSQFVKQDMFEVTDTSDFSLTKPGLYSFFFDNDVDSLVLTIGGLHFINEYFAPGAEITLFFNHNVNHLLFESDVSFRELSYPTFLAGGSSLTIRLVQLPNNTSWEVVSIQNMNFYQQRTFEYQDSTDFDITKPGLYQLGDGNPINTLTLTIKDAAPAGHPAFMLGDEISFYLNSQIDHLEIISNNLMLSSTAFNTLNGGTVYQANTYFTLKLVHNLGDNMWILSHKYVP